MPSRARHPWSSTDCDTLADMIKDGYPAKGIAAALGRSSTAIIGMAKKSGLRILRGKTRAFQVQVDVEAHKALVRMAAKRRVSANTLCRILLEIASRTPVFIDSVLDDRDRYVKQPPAPKAKPAPMSKTQRAAHKQLVALLKQPETAAPPSMPGSLVATIGSPSLGGAVGDGLVH